MTCIVAIAEKGKVWMGGDSAEMHGSVSFILDRPKVYKKDGLILGVSGNVRISDVIRHRFKVPKYKHKDEREWMCTVFTDALRKCYKNNDCLVDDEDGEQCTVGSGTSVLVGFRGKIYKIHRNLAVTSVASYKGTYVAAVGCCYDVAIGCVLAMDTKPPTERIEKALEICEHYYTGAVRKPFTIIST